MTRFARISVASASSGCGMPKRPGRRSQSQREHRVPLNSRPRPDRPLDRALRRTRRREGDVARIELPLAGAARLGIPQPEEALATLMRANLVMEPKDGFYRAGPLVLSAGARRGLAASRGGCPRERARRINGDVVVNQEGEADRRRSGRFRRTARRPGGGTGKGTRRARGGWRWRGGRTANVSADARNDQGAVSVIHKPELIE